MNDSTTKKLDPHQGPGFERVQIANLAEPKSGRGEGRVFSRYCQQNQAKMPEMSDSTTIFIDFHKKHPKTLCSSVVSRPAGAQVPIFTAQMKKASKKCQKNMVFFDFSNHARAQVPICTLK